MVFCLISKVSNTNGPGFILIHGLASTYVAKEAGRGFLHRK